MSTSRKGLRVTIAALSMFFLAGAAHAAEKTQIEVPTSPDAIEQARRAVDRLIADTSTDPMSAIQYRVSRILTCAAAAEQALLYDEARGQICICYEVNTRGESGGYRGRRLSTAMLQAAKDGAFAATTMTDFSYTADTHKACNAAGLEKRAPALIRAQVNQ